jgi:hypothetical protein
MSPALWGVVLGGIAGVGCWVVLERMVAIRRTPFEARVLPYLRDVTPGLGPQPSDPAIGSGSALGAVVGPVLRRAATEARDRLLPLRAAVRGGSSLVSPIPRKQG